jgi:enterochelin esterase-like enzyme
MRILADVTTLVYSMRRLAILFLIAVFAGSSESTHAQQGSGIAKEDLSISSNILSSDVGYTVYLPPDYETSSRYYPIVYLLHGYGGDESAWIQFGEVKRIADAAIATGEIPPMVIVMPDGGDGFYINSHDGKMRWEDMFVKEFIPQIEASYRIRKEKEFRGISGLSMGGSGALVLSMRNPDLFAATAAFSAGVWTDEQVTATPDDLFDELFGKLMGTGLRREARLTDHWRQNSVLNLAETAPVEELKKVRYYIDCGDDDEFLTIGNTTLHIILKQREIPHEYRVRDGGHVWEYWRTGLAAGLAFIGESFRR